MNEKNLPEGWGKAIYQSNRRYISKGDWFSALGLIRTCRSPTDCPMRRGTPNNPKCIVPACILRFPTAEDLMEFVR